MEQQRRKRRRKKRRAMAERLSCRRVTRRTEEAMVRRDERLPMRPTEVARLLRVSPRWIARNLQPTLNRNRLNLFLWEDVLEQLRHPELPDVPRREARPPRTPTQISPEVLALSEELAS